MNIECVSELWVYPGHAAWHFVTIPKDYVDDIRQVTTGFRRGFGSVRVTVSVGETTWETSIFPDTNSGSYLLPIKKAVRQAEGLTVGENVHLRLELHLNS